MGSLTDQYISLIGAENEFQKIYLEKSLVELRKEEEEELEDILNFFMQSGNSIETQAKAYLVFVEVALEETKYFLQNGSYRFHKLEEVEDMVYRNPSYMKNYMMGLTLSQYLWGNHRKMIRWFQEKIEKQTDGSYFEIGPGYGQYLFKAMKKSGMKNYSVIDISNTSLEGLMALSEYYGLSVNEGGGRIICGDFLSYKDTVKYDFLVMGEVLEHVENPDMFLNKIYGITNEKSKIIITTAINAPALDHIYLFKDIESVNSLVENSGFLIEDALYITSNGKSLDYALDKKQAINVSFLLKHR